MIPALLLGLALPSPARATGTSADTELVRPTLSAGGPPGIDTPWIERAGTLRVGAILQYERDPLVLYEYGDEAGTVVSHRQALHLGAALDLGGGTSARIVLPAAVQWGSEVPALAGDGALLGDLRVGLRVVPPLRGVARAGLRADLGLPTGSREAWMGEETPRLAAGLLAGLAFSSVDAALDVGVEARTARDTGMDLAVGTELTGGLGLRAHVWPETAALTAGLVARTGVTDLVGGAGEQPMELLTGVQLWPSQGLQLDLDLGKGLTPGYGTTELRVLGGLTWIRRPDPPPPPALPSVQLTALEDAPEAEEAPEPPPPATPWAEGQLARVEEERIVIRDPIQFAYATDRILPESQPTLAYVADLLAREWSIGHLVVEGHASDEGSFEYNYQLSISRARAVWEALVAEGVHPDRLSWRGMGEVAPALEGADEASLAANRRVVLRIVWRRRPGDEPPPPGGAGLLPWSGAPVQVQAPPPPPPPPPAPTPEATEEEPEIPRLREPSPFDPDLEEESP